MNDSPNASTATQNGVPNGQTQQGTPAGQPAAPAAPIAAAPHEPSLEERLAEAKRQGADEAAREWKGRYAGLQRTHESTRAELLRAQQNAQLLSGLPVLAKQVGFLLQKNASPEEIKRLETESELEILKAQQSSGLQQAQQAVAEAAQPTETGDRRDEILRYWAPDTALKFDDPRLDWAQDVPSGNRAEAQRRFQASIRKAEKEDAVKEEQALAAKQVQDERVRLGLETTDGGAPSGPITNPLLPQNPSEWKRPNEYFRRGFEQTDAAVSRRVQAKAIRRENEQQTAARQAAAAGSR